MSIKMKNELLNLPTLQSKMDNIVFDYIDSKPNWSKAYELLDALLHKVADNFNSFVAKNDGEMPTPSTYWMLYIDIASKLIYFTSLAHSNLIAEDDEDARAHIVQLYEIGASCIPNALLETNEELILEIKKSIRDINGNKQVELQLAGNAAECINSFYSFTKSYQ